MDYMPHTPERMSVYFTKARGLLRFHYKTCEDCGRSFFGSPISELCGRCVSSLSFCSPPKGGVYRVNRGVLLLSEEPHAL